MRLAKLIQYASALFFTCGSGLLHSAQAPTTRAIPQWATSQSPSSNMQLIPVNQSSCEIIPVPQQPFGTEQQMVCISLNTLQQLFAQNQLARNQSTAIQQQPSATPTAGPVVLNMTIQNTSDFNAKSTNQADTKNTSDTTTEASNDASNATKSNAAGGVGSGGSGKAVGGGGVGGGGVGGGGVGGGGVGGGGVGGGGVGDVSSEVESTGGSGGGGGRSGNNNNATHNNEYPSFPFNGHFNADDLRKTSEGMWQSCKKHAYKIMGAAALGAYGYMYYHVRNGKTVLKDKASWCNWHKEKNNSQLFTSSQLVNELMFEITSRYSDIMQPQNVALPVQTFFSTINQELKKLQHFASLTPWLKRLHITMFFPLSDKHIQACAEKIERLEGLRNVVAQHITQQHYASITMRGFSIPIRIPLSGSSKAPSKK